MLSTPSAAMQRSLTRKAKTRMEMGGGGGTSTGTRQPDILSLVLPLKSLSSLETGLLVGKGGGVFNLSSYNGLHGNKNKLSWEKSELFFPLWGDSRSFPLFCAGAAAQPRRAQVVSITGTGRKQDAMTCSLHLPCIPSTLLPWPVPLSACLSSKWASFILLT